MKNQALFLQPSQSRLNVHSALSISSQYDFEKGVLVNVPVELPKIKKPEKLPRLMRHFQSQQIQKFFILPQQQAKSSENRKHKRLIPFQLVKVQPPPLGYYKLNESALLQKSVVDMSKQSTARQMIRRHKSKSIDVDEFRQEPEQLQQKQKQLPKQMAELSKEKLSLWISKELEHLKEIKKFERTTYKGAMSNEQSKNDNFQRLFDITSKKIKSQYVKYFF